MKRLVFSIILLTLAVVCEAQKVVSVSGECQYQVPETVSIADAKKIAVDRAKNEAMAKEFGTVVSQTNTSTTKVVDGKVETDFLSIGGTESKGIWIEDTKEPEINIYCDNDEIWVEAKVWGKAREIKNSETEMEIKILCNGVEGERFKYIDKKSRENDKLSIDFKAAATGYVAIFVRDENLDPIYCLLPYETENGEARLVKSNTKYNFLSKKDSNYSHDEGTILTTEKDVESNTIIIVFSKNKFTLPLSDMGEFVEQIPAAKFKAWLHKNHIHDDTWQVIGKTVEIRKK